MCLHNSQRQINSVENNCNVETDFNTGVGLKNEPNLSSEITDGKKESTADAIWRERVLA